MIDIHRENYGVYGVGKMWHAMERVSHEIGRDQVARLMKNADIRPDLAKRKFRAPGSNRLWVADITYVRTRTGLVYTAFVTDVYSRKIVGWATKSRLTTEALPLDLTRATLVTQEGE